MAILRIRGESKTTETEIRKNELYIENEFSFRSDMDTSKPIEIVVESDDVYEINTEDGVVWFVSGTELLSNYSEKYPSSRGGTSIEIYEFKNKIVATNTRGIGNILNFNKLIKWAFGKAPVVETFLPPLIKKIDSTLVPEEGVYKWMYKENFGKKITTLTSSDPILLFIHGTVANAQGTFGNLFLGPDDSDWKELTVNFKTNIYAFQHHTLAKSPLQNTLDLIKILPDGVQINLVTSSRGGLIGELLTMASVYSNTPIYLDSLVETLSENNRTTDMAILSQLIDEAKHKKITITNYHRIACPALGTTIVSGRLDIYFKVILNLIGMIPVFKTTMVYDLVKELLINVVKSKADTSILPGLEAMMPSSPFIKGLNIRTEELEAKLRIFAGDIDPKGFFKSLEVFLVDAFYRAEHDFIVNSKSMFGGIKRSNTQYIFHKGNNVSHFNYYKNEQTRVVLYTSLKNSTTPSMYPLPTDLDIDAKSLTNNAAINITRGLYANHLKMIGDNTLIYSPQINEIIDEEDKIKISLKHGDLGYALFPLLVGHFKGDGIVAAEKEVDGHINYHLSQVHKAGVYPGAIETSEVFFNSYSSFKGAVVVGLGYPGQLSGESLTKAIQHGALNLALKSKSLSNDIKPIGISSLLVGSDYAGISIRTTIRCLIEGISNANQQIRNLKDPDIPAIKELEIIELFEDRAITVAKFINNFVLDEYSDFVQTDTVPLQKVGGAQKRFASDYSSEWWYHLQITSELDANNSIVALNFLLINNGAKAEAMRVPVQGVYLTKLIESCIANNTTNSTFSKLFFNSLIPISIKEFANDKRNFILILDGITASIPWEMLFNQTKDSDLPIAVKSGMIRQLRVDSPYFPISDVTTNNVLVIANPITNDDEYPPLPGAEKEGEEVGKLFNDGLGAFNCPAPLIERPFIDIMMSLNDLSYRIIHFAGHGNYDPENPIKSGMVLSDGFYLNPAELSKLSYIPELVFINCCHIGKIDKAIIKWNELAANLGTEFITLGVKCVVAAGWAVDDAAASTFAERFYRYMLDGGEFGEAIQHARKSIYDEHRNNNTWGAYQCYGDPFYKFNHSGENGKKTKESFISISELLVKLENLFQKIEPQSTRMTSSISEEIEEIEKIVNDKCKSVPEVIELIANCYYELGDYDKAIEMYEALFNNKSGSYKVDSILRLSRLKMNKGVELVLNGDKIEGQKLITFSKNITNNLLTLSSTPDKHIMKGGNLKREALIYDSTNKTERINRLTEARNEYRTAFEQILEINQTHDGYPLQNWIVLDEILRAYKNPSDTAPEKLLGFVKKSMKEHASKSTQTNTFFYNSYFAELLFCRLMTGKNSPKHINELESEIYKKYKEGWEVDGSFTKAEIILKQFDIVITLLKLDQSVTPVLTSLENLHLKLEKLFNLKKLHNEK